MKRDKNNSWKTTKHDRKNIKTKSREREKGVQWNFKELTKNCQLSKDGTSRGKRTRVASCCLYLSGIFCFHFFFSSSSLFLSFRSAVKRFSKKRDENITVHILVFVPRPLKIVVMSYSPYVATTGLKGFWPFPFSFFFILQEKRET